MKLGDKRKFSNPETIKELISLRTELKWSFPKIARHFECDHTSVMYQLRKHGIIHTPKKRKKTPKIERFPVGCCKVCGMRLDSNYHKENPCI